MPKHSENTIFIAPQFQPPKSYVFPKEKLEKGTNGSMVTGVTIFHRTDFQVIWIQALLRKDPEIGKNVQKRSRTTKHPTINTTMSSY